MLKNLKNSNSFFWLCLVVNVATLPFLTAFANPNENSTTAIGNDDTEFVFAGRCPNGETYRIFSYQMEIDGLTQSFSDYEGPAGKGTIRTNVQPKKLLTRLCHELADINDGSKFD
jgi:hypothetical protein